MFGDESGCLRAAGSSGSERGSRRSSSRGSPAAADRDRGNSDNHGPILSSAWSGFLPRFSSHRRVSWTNVPPSVRVSLCRAISYSSARSTALNEFKFLISILVPRVSLPAGRTEILASQRKLPSSMLPSQTPKILEDRAERAQISPGFFGGAHVGFADDFQQRHAGAVEIDQTRVAVGVVNIFAGVLFHVDARQAHPFGGAVEFELDVAVAAQIGSSYWLIW